MKILLEGEYSRRRGGPRLVLLAAALVLAARAPSQNSFSSLPCPRAFAFGAEGATAFILGGYAGKAGDADDGKFTLTLRREKGGRWMIVSDMDNGNRPPKRQP